MEPMKVFWGLVLKPEKRYQQTAEESFHISKACLDPQHSGKGITSVYVEADNDEFIVCNLAKDGGLSETLDLNFLEGETICFRIVGNGTVHLTGYLMPDEEEGDMSAFMGEESEEEDEEETPALVELPKNKRKMEEMANGNQVAKKSKGKHADEMAPKLEAIQKALKMNKQFSLTARTANADDEEDSDDDDYDDEEEEEEGEEEEEEEEDDEGEEDSDDEESMEEIQASPKKGAANGKTPQKSPIKAPKGETPGKKTPKKEAQATPGKAEKTPKKTPGKVQDAAATSPAKTPKRTMKGGIQVTDIMIGSGPEAKRGKHVGMLYEGRLANNGKVFDSNMKTRKPFKFRLGGGEVIKGWDVGLEGIKVNGVRELVIPAKMAYGSQGAPPDIPPNAMLKFKVECKYVS